MAAKLINISTYTPVPADCFFFDNNIWMYLFCPLGNYNMRKQSEYSSFLQKVRSSDCEIYANSMVLSEFANSYLRLDFKQWIQDTGNHGAEFKRDYVGTEQYKSTADEIRIQINRILGICERVNDSFNAIDMSAVFSHFQAIDFNDSYYIELGKIWNWKFVTDDRDFVTYTNHNLDVISIA
jgi:predicted nucleic acid-binding protein